jgi:trehalose 6-phosphate synthase/phosphatase
VQRACIKSAWCDGVACWLQAKELIDHLESVMLGEAVEVVSGLKYVECKPRGLSKGTMVQKLLRQVKPDFVLCVGDDKSDEQMFETLVEESLDSMEVFACTVGQKPSRANFYVNDNTDVLSILSRLVDQPASSPPSAMES